MLAIHVHTFATAYIMGLSMFDENKNLILEWTYEMSSYFQAMVLQNSRAKTDRLIICPNQI